MKMPTERGSTFLFVPDNGELRVRSADFFRHRAEWVAKYSSGKGRDDFGLCMNWGW